MFKLILSLFSIVFFISIQVSHANANLYQAVVLFIEKPEENIRQELIRQALKKVLTRLTGSDDYMKNEGGRAVLDNAESFVQQFSYEDLSNDKPETLEQEPSLKRFIVTFNKSILDKKLNEVGLTVWNSFRPKTLLWLSIEKDRKRSIASVVNEPQHTRTLKDAADLYGLELLFPLADTEDLTRLSIADLWGNFTDVILAASQRYHTSSVLTGRIHQDISEQWVGNWSLYLLGKQKNWKIKNNQLKDLLAQGVKSLLKELSTELKLNQSASRDNRVLIQINNVTSFDSYQKLRQYLAKVPVITDFQFKQLYIDKVSYEVKFMGSRQHLIYNLTVDDLLQSVEQTSEKKVGSAIQDQSDYKPLLLDQLKDNEAQPNTQAAAKNIQAGPLSQTDLPTGNNVSKAKTVLLPDLQFWFNP